MRFYHFSEQPYPDAWDHPHLRVDLPNGYCDPETASKLYNRYLDEWMIADELGLDVKVNEHHSTATCMSTSVNLTLAILARQTKRARILALGQPIGNRHDPLRIAEEMSMIDVISGGRLEMGFVKGVPTELPIANLNPVGLMDRFWEAHDLIIKAMTTRDGPFRWEGRHYQYRSVNIWPRPMQQPHPPVWITTLSPSSAQGIAERGYVIATVLGGYATKVLFERYRQCYVELGRPEPHRDRFAYSVLAAVGSNEQEARRRAELVRGYVTSANKSKAQFRMPPGYFGQDVMAKLIKSPPGDHMIETKDGRRIGASTASLDDLIAAGVLLCGTPDQVFNQVLELENAFGGIGHLMLMFQAGFTGQEDTVGSMTLFAKEVMPRLQEYERDLLRNRGEPIATPANHLLTH